MSELVLHIGMPKTGTSALQTFFTTNRGRLAESGWAYPEMIVRSKIHNGEFLMRYCLGLTKDDAANPQLQNLEENMRRLTSALTAYEHVLISEENFYVAPTWRSSQDIENSVQKFWEAVSRTVKEFSVSQTTIILYIRRQDEWLYSFWKQRPKIGVRIEPFDDFIANNRFGHILHYYELIDTIERAFDGSCEAVVRLYDRTQFEGGDIFHDFCHAAGISWDSEFAIPKEKINPSLTLDVAEALRPFYNVAPPGSPLRNKLLIPLAYALSEQAPDPLEITPYKKGEATSIVQAYESDNRKLAKRFFGRDELFPTVDNNRIVWEPNLERIAECRELFQKECDSYNRHLKLSDIKVFGARCKNKAIRTLRAIKGKLDAWQTKPKQGVSTHERQ